MLGVQLLAIGRAGANTLIFSHAKDINEYIIRETLNCCLLIFGALLPDCMYWRDRKLAIYWTITRSIQTSKDR